MSTQEPMTEAGKAWWAELDRGADQLLAADPREEWVADAWGRDSVTRERILAIESDARAIGAQQERERVRRFLWSMYSEDDGLVSRDALDRLLSDPQPDAPVAEQTDV